PIREIPQAHLPRAGVAGHQFQPGAPRQDQRDRHHQLRGLRFVEGLRPSMERDEAWKRVFAALPVAEYLARDGIFQVTAEDLKAHGAREPRLMAKIDTLAERPAILAEHGLALFPVRNGRYVLFPDPAQKS